MKIDAENYMVVFGSNQITNCGKVIEIVGKGINKQIVRFKEGPTRKYYVIVRLRIKKEKQSLKLQIACCSMLRKVIEQKFQIMECV